MSIQTELTRITNAKSAIKAAIEGKGVTVPDGTLLDGMAALIESIEAGGGLQNNRMVHIANGSFTMAEKTEMSNDNRFILQHDCGVIPLLIIIKASTNPSSTGDLVRAVFWRIENYYDSSQSIVQALSTRVAKSSYEYSCLSTEMGTASGKNWTTEHVSLVSPNSTIYFSSGIQYDWYAKYAD